MNANIFARLLLLALLAGGVLWALAAPAQAQRAFLTAGCVCPAGSAPLGANTATCIGAGGAVPAICPSRNAGAFAAGEIQQSFWGIQQMLTGRRDRLQATPVNIAGSKASGYAETLDGDGKVLAYAGQSQKDNPLASPLYDAAPAAAPPDPVYGAWVQGLGDWEHDDVLSASDTAHFTATYTGQGGVDRMWRSVIDPNDALVAGIVTSWTSAHVGYDGTPTTVQMYGPGVGVYSQYVRGGFSGDLTGKFDFLQLNQIFQSATTPNSSISVLNAGVSGNVQYKFTGENNGFFEPTMGFTLSHTGFGSGAAALNLEDAYTVKLQAGARVGTTWDLGHGVTADGSFKALAYGDAVAQGTSVAGLGTGLPVLSPSDSGRVRGEFDPELCFNLPDNYSLTLSGQVRTGYALIGGSAGVNLRKAW